MKDTDTFRPDPKFAGDALTYGFNLASKSGLNDGSSADRGWLQGDTIVSSSWAVVEGDGALTVVGSAFTTKKTTVKLSAGTPGATYLLENTITTATGEVKVLKMELLIKVA